MAPFEVEVNLDDVVSTEAGTMWVVLSENPYDPTDGYVIVYAPENATWGLAENVSGKCYVLVCTSDTFAQALESM